MNNKFNKSKDENNTNKETKKPMIKQMQPETPYMFPPPGTAYNPIGVPPAAGTPGKISPRTRPIDMPPGRDTPGMQPTMPPGRGTPDMQPTMPRRESPVDFGIEPGPPVTTSRQYLQGYLRTIIGRYVRIDFIVGTNMFVDREGTLLDVGIDHVVLREPETDDLLICDLYSIKFVKVYF